MNTRFAAATIAAVSTATLLAMPATPAAAIDCTATTYGSTGYTLVNYPRTIRVHDNTLVTTRGTLRRGGACQGEVLGHYVKKASKPTYRLSARATTDSRGSVRVKVLVDETLRTFYNFSTSGTTAARSWVAEYVVVR